ncbi:MAG TPA: hypothetical protein VE956_01975 [Nodularia sp. (in: cyanobacteria)]|nr:hypothetical protein [Nodularia sp. (in: cyanobacteria)]
MVLWLSDSILFKSRGDRSPNLFLNYCKERFAIAHKYPNFKRSHSQLILKWRSLTTTLILDELVRNRVTQDIRQQANYILVNGNRESGER